MHVTHDNHRRETQQLHAALELSEKTHGQLDWQKLQEELSSTQDYLRHTEAQKADSDARVSVLESELNTKVRTYV